MEAARHVYLFDKLPENVHRSGLVDSRGKCPWLNSRRLCSQVYSPGFGPLSIVKQDKTMQNILKISRLCGVNTSVF